MRLPTAFAGLNAKLCYILARGLQQGAVFVETIQHKLQEFELGIVWLDQANKIIAMNGLAEETLGRAPGELIGEEVLQLHPAKSRDKVRFLLEQSACPVSAPPPMAMMINIPERVLLIKVSKMRAADGPVGTCMVFYDLTDLATTAVEADNGGNGAGRRRLFKLPVYKDRLVLLIDIEDVCFFKADGHYTTLYTRDADALCNLSLSDLEERVMPEHFLRVHRSYIANLKHARAFEKEDENCYLTLNHKGGARIPISRAKVGVVKGYFGLG